MNLMVSVLEGLISVRKNDSQFICAYSWASIFSVVLIKTQSIIDIYIVHSQRRKCICWKLKGSFSNKNSWIRSHTHSF